MQNRARTLEPIAALFFGAWLGIGAQKVTDQHIGWLIYGLIGIPGIVLTLVLVKLRWDEATREQKVAKTAAEISAKYPQIR